MKKIINICLVALAAFALNSCEEQDHAENQKVTYYPEITLEEGSPYAFQVGETWADPGYSALLQGEDVTADVKVSGDVVNGNESGIYNIKYSYINEDGFESSASRMVVVYDIASASTTDISGKYADTNLSRFSADGTLNLDFNKYLSFAPATCEITRGPATGLFYIKDLFVAIYDKFYAYGSAYAYNAFVLLNADNTINILNGADIDPWGNLISDNEPHPSVYDPATGSVTINWNREGTAYLWVTTYKDKQ